MSQEKAAAVLDRDQKEGEKIKRRLVVVLTLTVLLSLAVISAEAAPKTEYTPPEIEPTSYEKSFEASYDSVWEKTVAYFNTNYYKNIEVDKDTGTLRGEWTKSVFDTGGTYFKMDCGNYSQPRSHDVAVSNIVAKFDVRVSRSAEDKTNVRVNTEATGYWAARYTSPFRGTYRVGNDYLEEMGVAPTKCVSKGVIEKAFFSRIKKQIDREKKSEEERIERERKAAEFRNFVFGQPWDKEIKEAILSSKIMLGMTPEQVRLSWGKPRKINSTVSVRGTREQWIYDDTYLYFENDRLTTWQTTK